MWGSFYWVSLKCELLKLLEALIAIILFFIKQSIQILYVFLYYN